MNNKIVQLLYKTFVNRGFATLRFNFRGVGKSQGTFDNGIGELSDAASAPEAFSATKPPDTLVPPALARSCWILTTFLRMEHHLGRPPNRPCNGGQWRADPPPSDALSGFVQSRA